MLPGLYNTLIEDMGDSVLKWLGIQLHLLQAQIDNNESEFAVETYSPLSIFQNFGPCLEMKFYALCQSSQDWQTMSNFNQNYSFVITEIVVTGKHCFDCEEPWSSFLWTLAVPPFSGVAIYIWEQNKLLSMSFVTPVKKICPNLIKI